MRLFTLVLVLLIATFSVSADGRARPSSGTGTSTPAGSATRTSVLVEHTGTDPAGRAFVAGLRSALRTSTQFRLTESADDANLVMVVVSVSPSPDSQVASAVSLAYVANNEWRSLLGTGARFVGADRADAMGRDTVSELSKVLAAYLSAGAQ